MGTQQVMFMGWMGVVTENVHSSRRGGVRTLAEGRWATLRSALLGVGDLAAGATGGDRKQYLGGTLAGEGGSPALRARTGQGTQHRPQVYCTQKPPNLESTPRPNSGGTEETAKAERMGGEPGG